MKRFSGPLIRLYSSRLHFEFVAASRVCPDRAAFVMHFSSYTLNDDDDESERQLKNSEQSAFEECVSISISTPARI
jgi:hypothetical protein